jgi:uncharacterized protein YndB with AHSA1/START domain
LPRQDEGEEAMNRPSHQAARRLDPQLDLWFERVVDIPPPLVWAAWTTEEHIKHWFTPAPWRTIDCRIDLYPGGIFHTVMLSPEGQEFPNVGCYLEIVPQRRLVWSNAVQPGFRPAARPASVADFPFTAVIEIEAQDAGSKYTATVMHADVEARDRHAAMGFQEGWGKALDQLVAYMKTL